MSNACIVRNYLERVVLFIKRIKEKIAYVAPCEIKVFTDDFGRMPVIKVFIIWMCLLSILSPSLIKSLG